MAQKAFDYSKWDKIELSDDESDLHPNIDKDSWFRLKHRTRIEREEREDAEIKEIIKLNGEDKTQLNLVNARIRSFESGELAEDEAELFDVEAMKVETKELMERINKREKRIEEINERRKWNIDNICKVKEEKTIVNNNL
jgi:cell division cycle protein 37